MNIQVIGYSGLMATPDTPQPPEPRWLSPEQLEAWQTFMLMQALLPTALEQQLECDAQLSFVEYYVLAGLSDQPDHTMRMSRLAILTNAELSRLSHLMRRLEKRGFVRREPDPKDGRYTNAILTEAGYDHLVKAAPGHVARVRELVIDALDDESLRALRDASQRIVSRIVGTQPGC